MIQSVPKLLEILVFEDNSERRYVDALRIALLNIKS